MRVRRLKILGVALGLSFLASILGIVAYSIPKAKASSVNRIADYVILNQAMFFIRDLKWSKVLHLPNYDEPNDKLRLIGVDEATLQDPPNGLGQWPLPRSIYGAALQRLAKAHAKVTTFDILFTESSPDRKQDDSLLAGMRAQRTVLGFPITTTQTGVLGATKPVARLDAVSAAIGYTTVDNPGGWMVGQPLVNGPYRSLAAATLEQYTGTKVQLIDNWRARIGNREIPLDGDGSFLMLPFATNEHVDLASTNGLAGRQGASNLSAPFFEFVPLADFQKFDNDTVKAFANEGIVVIGPTAQALGDFVVTPNGRYPGVFTNLRIMDQLMTGKFIRRVPPALDIALIIILPLIIGFVVTQLKPVVGIGVAAGVVLLYSVFSVALYLGTLHWMNLIHVASSTLLAALFVAMYRVVTEGADKRVIREMFGKHVSPAIVEQMLNHDDPLKALDLSGKRVKVTIFYSDIRGFTAMSENMSPEQIYGQLNEYFEEMCKIVFQHGGYVDKFIGDCLMAVHSAPNPTPDDAYNAVRSAWDQQQRILEMMTEWAAEGRQIFTVGMGLNTGEVVMGNLGSSDRLNYTVIGDNVNTAARLYNVAKGGQTIISESTYNEVKDRFIVKELTPVFVKGKVLPLRNFELVGLLEPGMENTSEIHDPENMPEAFTADAH